MLTTAQKDTTKSQYYPGNNMPIQTKEKDEIVDQPKNIGSNDSSFNGNHGYNENSSLY